MWKNTEAVSVSHQDIEVFFSIDIFFYNTFYYFLYKTRTKHLKTIWDIKSLRIYPRIARKYLCYVSIFQKQTKNIL